MGSVTTALDKTHYQGCVSEVVQSFLVLFFFILIFLNFFAHNINYKYFIIFRNAQYLDTLSVIGGY